jgi:hypothetical protein
VCLGRFRAGLIVAAVFACAAPVALAGSSSPGSLLASFVRAGNAQRSVHDVSLGISAYAKVSMVDDAGTNDGVQRITFTQAHRTGHVTVIANASAAYARGDAFTLTNYMGFKASAAKKYAGAWIKFVKGGTGYATVAAGVDLRSTMTEIKPVGPFTTVPETTSEGQRVIGVRGQVNPSSGVVAIDTVFARATGLPLPVSQVATIDGKVRYRATFSKWNEPLQVAIPSTSVPVAVVISTP